MTWAAPREVTKSSFALAAHASDLSQECLGQLHRVASDSARCADDEYPLPWLDLAGIGECLQRSACGDRDDGGLGEGQVPWFAGQLVLANGGVLGEDASEDSEDLVAGREPGTIAAVAVASSVAPASGSTRTHNPDHPSRCTDDDELIRD